MATTINTIEDLVRVLDENPEWLEALRTRLLTRELIELPRLFAEFAASVNQRFDEQDKVLAGHTETLAEHGRILAGHTETLVEHGSILVEQGKVLAEHSSILVEQGKVLVEHSKILAEHGKTLAEHGKTLAEHTAMLTEQGKVLAEHSKTLAEHGKTLAEHTAMLTEQGKVLAEHSKVLAGHTETLAEHSKILAEHSEEFVSLKREVRLLRDDVGDLKGPRAEEEAGKDIAFIAEQLGLALTRVLTRDDLLALLRAQPLPDLPSNVRNSFTKADIIAEAVDEAGETRYIAVEASYTVNGRDTERAVRNAGILTRLTGKPALSVVAGYRMDDRERSIIESGEVFWHELER